MRDIDKLFNEIESNMTVEQQLNYYKKLYELQQKHIQSQEEELELYKEAYASAHEVNIIQGKKLDKIENELRNIHMDTISRRKLLNIINE